MQYILILKVYITIGGKIYGIKEVLELWVRANESSKYWLDVLTEIRDRGVEDILIISINNLKYFMSDLKEVYKATTEEIALSNLEKFIYEAHPKFVTKWQRF